MKHTKPDIVEAKVFGKALIKRVSHDLIKCLNNQIDTIGADEKEKNPKDKIEALEEFSRFLEKYPELTTLLEDL